MPLPVPPLLLITDRTQAHRPLVDVVAAALKAGCRWISVREKDVSEAEQIALVETLRPLARQHGTLLTLHGEAALAQRAGADGVHLPAGADVIAARRLLGAQALIGISVHRTHELSRLADGVDYVVVGPAYATASKPGYGPAFGPAGIAEFATASRYIFLHHTSGYFGETNPFLKSASDQEVMFSHPPGPSGLPGERRLPVIPVGGITPRNIAPLMAAGATGIAVMGGVMRADDPGDEVMALLSAMRAR
jgi:thiamine-phosphate pyrophosphorylase